MAHIVFLLDNAVFDLNSLKAETEFHLSSTLVLCFVCKYLSSEKDISTCGWVPYHKYVMWHPFHNILDESTMPVLFLAHGA